MNRRLICILLIFSVLLSAQNFGSRLSLDQNKDKQSTSLSDTEKKVESMELIQEEFALDRAIDKDKYIVGPGDVFGVNIVSIETINKKLTITPSGELFIPNVGIIYISGKTLNEALSLINEFIGKKFKSADINVTLINIRKFQIQISGAVMNPGFYIINPVTRLHKVLKQCSGFQQLAKENTIEIKSLNGISRVINFNEFVLNGDLESNPTFIEGDQIIVPFGNLEENGVVIRGSVLGSGYDIIEEEESLQRFLRRQTLFGEDADLQYVTITRKENQDVKVITVLPPDFSKTVLKPGDAIDILSERGVSVNGFVETPGSFIYFAGYTALDYVNMAGGNTIEGDASKLVVIHFDGSREKGDDIEIRRGDVIIVPRSTKNVWFGELSILQIVTSVTSVILTFIAATN